MLLLGHVVESSSSSSPGPIPLMHVIHGVTHISGGWNFDGVFIEEGFGGHQNLSVAIDSLCLYFRLQGVSLLCSLSISRGTAGSPWITMTLCV